MTFSSLTATHTTLFHFSPNSATPIQPTHSCPIFVTSIAITKLVQATNFYEITRPIFTALPTELGAIYIGYSYSLIFQFLGVYRIMTFALNSNNHLKKFSYKVHKDFF